MCQDELRIGGDDNARAVDVVENEDYKKMNISQSNEYPAPQSENPGYDPAQAWDILLQTVSLLKDARNEALKSSLPFVAAQQYDKAINYCSVAYIDFQTVGTVEFLTELNGHQVQHQ
jgi:hypothetical protein